MYGVRDLKHETRLSFILSQQYATYATTAS